MFGNGLSGIATNVLAVVLKLIIGSGDDKLYTIGLVYFVLSAIFMVGSAFLFSGLMKNEYYIY